MFFENWIYGFRNILPVVIVVSISYNYHWNEVIIIRDKTRRSFNTTLNKDLLLSLKILAVKRDVNLNTLIEEGIKHVLEKYEGRN